MFLSKQPLEQFNKARLLEEVTKYLKVGGKFIFGILIRNLNKLLIIK